MLSRLIGCTIQMGSHMKNTIFEERIASGLRRWHQKAKTKIKTRNSVSQLSSRGGTRSFETTPSLGSSPLHLMHRYNNMGVLETPGLSPRYYHSEYEAAEAPDYTEATKHRISKQIETSNLEMIASCSYPAEPTGTVLTTEALGMKEAREQHPTPKNLSINSRDFSFVKF